jgi:dihydrofolate synthase / folylpolyglutamate synthase
MRDDIETYLARMYHPGLKAIEPGLERIAAFLGRIGAPHKRLPPVVHVAGTNGKGSLLANLQAILEAGGYSVHRYSSPHLIRFNERIILNGKQIDDDYLLDLLRSLNPLIEEHPVTFFESTTAAAFLAFAEHPADVVLLEVGMGGKWDATNVVENPLLTAITPVSLDHCNFLGDNISDIAGEKAGIIKRGVPCVMGRQDHTAANVIIQQAESRSAPLYRHGHDWQVRWEGRQGEYQSPERSVIFSPALEGQHQFDNAASAIACVDKLPQFALSDVHIRQGIASAVWPARLQPLTRGHYARLLPRGMSLWLDGGHNPQGGEMLAQWFREQKQDVYVVCGMVKGKDSAGYLKSMAPFIRELHAVAIPGEEQSQPAEQLLMAARNTGIRAHAAPDIEKALQTIARHARTPAIICICGSLYLAGRVLAANEE